LRFHLHLNDINEVPANVASDVEDPISFVDQDQDHVEIFLS